MRQDNDQLLLLMLFDSLTALCRDYCDHRTSL